MSRGSKDVPLTKLLHENGLLLNKCSFIGYRKEDMTPHLYLAGNDKVALRPRIFSHHRNRCSVCGAYIQESEYPVSMRGNWHHPYKCDCVGCSELRCDPLTGRPCHAHRTLGFKRVAESRVRWSSGEKTP